MSETSSPLLVALDSCIPLAVLLPKPGTIAPAELRACRAVFDALNAGELHGSMSALALAEFLYAMGRDGATVEQRRETESDLLRLLTIIPVDAAIASAAAEHRLTHYHRTRSPISYADSVALIAAQQSNAQLITVDAPLLALKDPRITLPSQLRLNPS